MKPRINVVWNEIYCKRCLLCVEICPVQVLSPERKAIQLGYDFNLYED
jgi:ferredoxin